MTGVIEQLLTARHGPPREKPADQPGLVVRLWGSSVLYYRLDKKSRRPAALDPIYGDAHAGHLADGALKLASCGPPEVYGVYDIAEYAEQPELQEIRLLLPDAIFFIDAANVYFYAVVSARVVQYDAETTDVDDLGEPEAALARVIDEWDAAGS